MSFVLDTSVAIELRDFNDALLNRLTELGGTAHFSIITQIELLNGLHANGEHKALRAQRVAVLLRRIPVLEFSLNCATAYETIVAQTSFSRRKILDRMIAAQSLAVDATLITLNPDDFTDIPNLKLIGW